MNVPPPNKPTIRTLLKLFPSETSDGRPVLKGILPRVIETTDDDGNQRRYPKGTQLVLRKTKVGSYVLTAFIDEIDHEERRADFEQARQEAIANPPEIDIPF